MTMYRYPLFFMIMALAPWAGHAQAQSRNLGLMEVYSLALERDATHAAERAARDAGVEKGKQGAAVMLPQVFLEGSVGYTDQNITYKGTELLQGGHTNYPGGGYSISVAQPLFRMRNMAVRRQGKAAAQMARIAYHLAGQNMIQRTADAYFNALLAQNTIDFIDAQKQAISEHLARARKSYELGAASITDTHEAQARFDITVSQEIMARQGLLIAGEELTKIIGETGFTLAPLREDFTPAPPMPDDIEKWTEEALAASPYLELKQKALQVAAEETAKVKGDRLPALDVVANYNYLNQGGSSFGIGMENTTQSVNLRVSDWVVFSIPI
ncbi:MAG: TolC family protein, partial [Nitrospinota bacterium]|nr:TolC family protein [Nitrospinota bacterium]